MARGAGDRAGGEVASFGHALRKSWHRPWGRRNGGKVHLAGARDGQGTDRDAYQRRLTARGFLSRGLSCLLTRTSRQIPHYKTHMKLLACLVAVFFILVGVTGVLRPADLMAIGYHLLTPTGLYAVAALRIAIGLVLVLVAPVSRAPNGLRFLGTMILLVGVATAFVGVDHARTMLDWWMARGPAFIRMSAGAAIAIGAFVAYVVAAGRRAA
jgi:hypothetical protein